MKKWEYIWTESPSIERLNKLGEDGWEVCAMLRNSPTSIIEVWLKREIEDGNEVLF